MSEWADDRYCIACGERNPIGMHLHFELKDSMLETKYAFPKEFQGYSGVTHGGMISLLLDEVMVNLPLKKLNVPVVSAELKIKLKKPLAIGAPVTAKAWVEKERGRLYNVKSTLTRDEDGAIIAEGEAVCVRVKAENFLV